MQKTILGAAWASIPELIAILIGPIAALAPEGPLSTSSTESPKPYFATLRDDQRSKTQPCLVGTPSCLSVYPPPSPCLVSIARCSAHGHLEFADAESR
jgi:hypothetical protein